MNSKITIEMQNTFGRFLQLYNLNRAAEADYLFTDDAVFWMPDLDIRAEGIEEIRATLRQLQEKRIAAGADRDVHMPHTPCYDVRENDTLALGTWDLHTFYVDAKKGEMEYDYGRIDGEFVEDNGMWKFRSLDWWDVESFVPWQYDLSEDDGWSNSLADIPAPPAFTGKTSGRDFYEINNMISRYGQNNRKYAFDDTFADSDEVSYYAEPLTTKTVRGKAAVQAELDRLDQLEKDNIGKYVLVPATGGPVIEVSRDGQSADCQWMVSTSTLEGEAFGINSPPYMYVRRLGLLTVKCVRENGKWRVLSFDLRQIMRVPGFGFDSYCQLKNTGNNKWYQRVGMPENRWHMAPPKMGGDFPDELPLLEGMLAHWVSAYRRGDYENFLARYSLNDEFESFFHSRGQGRCAPAVIGTENLKEFFSLGVFKYHHQQITNHGGMSPDIEISADGRYATMSYFDINTTAFDPRKANSRTIDIDEDWNQDNAGFEHTPCRYQISMYNLAAAKVQGEWKLIQIDWDTLAAFPVIYLAGKSSRGWAGTVTDFKYPDVFEKYQYSPIRKVKK